MDTLSGEATLPFLSCLHCQCGVSSKKERAIKAISFHSDPVAVILCNCFVCMFVICFFC